MIVLGIETSCDETSASIIKDGELLTNIVHTQKIHEEYGGVVPELASQEHLNQIMTVIQASLLKANLNLSSIDAIAVTYGPGLMGSLLIGLNFAKAMSLSLNIPFLGVNHLEGHLYSNYIDNDNVKFPHLCCLVSGGHTQLWKINDFNNYNMLGSSIDDAAGEAFDKLSRFCGFGFPCGPAIQRIAESGNPSKINLPRPKTKHEYNYSFSGLKTAATNFLKNIDPDDKITRADFAASYQEAIVDSLMINFTKAVKETGVKNISGGGGVMANSRLREKMNILANDNNLEIFLPSPRLSTDNAAMICVAAQNDLITNDLKENDVRLSSIIK